MTYDQWKLEALPEYNEDKECPEDSEEIEATAEVYDKLCKEENDRG